MNFRTELLYDMDQIAGLTKLFITERMTNNNPVRLCSILEVSFSNSTGRYLDKTFQRNLRLDAKLDINIP